MSLKYDSRIDRDVGIYRMNYPGISNVWHHNYENNKECLYNYLNYWNLKITALEAQSPGSEFWPKPVSSPLPLNFLTRVLLRQYITVQKCFYVNNTIVFFSRCGCHHCQDPGPGRRGHQHGRRRQGYQACTFIYRDGPHWISFFYPVSSRISNSLTGLARYPAYRISKTSCLVSGRILNRWYPVTGRKSNQCPAFAGYIV